MCAIPCNMYQGGSSHGACLRCDQVNRGQLLFCCTACRAEASAGLNGKAEEGEGKMHLNQNNHGAAVGLIMFCSDHRGQMVAAFLVKDPCSIS